MFIPRIYYPHPLLINEIITFDKTTSHYLTQVLRLKNDASVILFNGEGGEYLAKYHAVKKSGRETQVLVLSFQEANRESSLALHLGQGLVRGDRMDLVIQKATELGATSITPLISKHCAVKLDEERASKRLSHWQNIAISAAEQSGRTQLPIIHPPISLAEWVKQDFHGTSLLFEPTSPLGLKNIVSNQAIRLAIGPESGWDITEVNLMTTHQFTACRLGPRIFRTETAGIVALSILQGLFGDLNL
jgi:16S rRNA (uracil1498-N3)-methyltransferase